MDMTKKLTWRWKLPMLVLGVELALLLALPALFPQSQSRPLQWLYVLAAWPLSGPVVVSVAWLAALHFVGRTIEMLAERGRA